MRKKFYPTLAEAQRAVKVLAITSVTNYQDRYREDPRLPSGPHNVYNSEWKSWPAFLGKEVCSGTLILAT